MTKPNRLLRFQKRARSWLSKRDRAILAMEQGLGKTVVAAVDFEPPGIVICTGAMKYTWEREFRKWRPELRTQVILTSKDELDPEADVHIISYDLVTRTQSIVDADKLISDLDRVAKKGGSTVFGEAWMVGAVLRAFAGWIEHNGRLTPEEMVRVLKKHEDFDR